MYKAPRVEFSPSACFSLTPVVREHFTVRILPSETEAKFQISIKHQTHQLYFCLCSFVKLLPHCAETGPNCTEGHSLLLLHAAVDITIVIPVRFRLHFIQWTINMLPHFFRVRWNWAPCPCPGNLSFRWKGVINVCQPYKFTGISFT